MESRIDQCRRSVDEAPVQFMMADLEFHMELWNRTGNGFLVELLSRLVIPLFAFETRAVVPLLSREDRMRNVETHGKVMELLRAGEVVGARYSMARIMEGFGWQTGGLSA